MDSVVESVPDRVSEGLAVIVRLFVAERESVRVYVPDLVGLPVELAVLVTVEVPVRVFVADAVGDIVPDEVTEEGNVET